MSLAAKVLAVQQAELDCVLSRAEAVAAVDQLKSEFKRGATPVRIVVSGFALGIAAGWRSPRGNAPSLGGKLFTGPLMSMVFDSVLPGLLAGLTAASTVEEEIVEVVDDTVDAKIDAVESAASGLADDEPVPAVRRKRKPRKRRVDSA